MDLSNSVIIPREDFFELQAEALTPLSAGQRIAGTIQTTVIFGAMSAASVAGVWGWVKATDWLEERRFQRAMRKNAQTKNPS